MCWAPLSFCLACLRMSNSLSKLREWKLFVKFLRYLRLLQWPKRLPVSRGMLLSQCAVFSRKRAVSPLPLAQGTRTGSWKLPPNFKCTAWWPLPFELCTMKRPKPLVWLREWSNHTQRPGVEPPKRMRIDHDMGGKTSPQPPPKPSTQPSSSSKRPQQQKDGGHDGKRSRETAAQSSSSSYHRQAPADWDWHWQSWQRQGYSDDYHDWNNQYGSRR